MAFWVRLIEKQSVCCFLTNFICMKAIFILLLGLFFFIDGYAQPSVSCDSVLQLGTCAGSQVIVPFTVTGGNFNFGNVFKAQLSDNFGNWGNPVQIGQITWFTSGILFATLPQNVSFSFFYKVRIISTNPVDTSNVSPNSIIVTQSAFLNSVNAFPNDTACWGDTITLGVLTPGASYSWNTGDTTQTILVTAPGQYICTSTDILNCTSQDTLDVYFELCGNSVGEIINEENFILFPNPSAGHFNLHWQPGRPAVGLLSVQDLAGRTLKEIAIDSGKIRIDLSTLSKGMYLVRLVSGNSSFTKPILI